MIWEITFATMEMAIARITSIRIHLLSPIAKGGQATRKIIAYWTKNGNVYLLFSRIA
jgi:hypothetical protein